MTDDFSMKDHFSTYFTMLVADTPELKKEVFRVRYEVYCQELGYESPDKFPDGMERDNYDEHSIHCLLQHKSTGIYAGCVRLILPHPDNSEAQFPFENICKDHSINFQETPRYMFGEISRLAVLARFRKRKGEENTSTGLIMFNDRKKEKELQQNQQRRSAVIALSLYLASIGILFNNKFDYGFTLMEPRLARHLRMVGILSHPIGKTVDFHGKRGPFILNTAEIVDNFQTKPELNDLFETILSRIGSNTCDDSSIRSCAE